jgi:hypothetical protein
LKGESKPLLVGDSRRDSALDFFLLKYVERTSRARPSFTSTTENRAFLSEVNRPVLEVEIIKMPVSGLNIAVRRPLGSDITQAPIIPASQVETVVSNPTIKAPTAEPIPFYFGKKRLFD